MDGGSSVNRGVDDLVARIRAQHPDWRIDSLFEFGSGAREESVSSSDVDLCLLVHSAHAVLLDKAYNRDRYAESLRSFRARYTGLPTREIDTWGGIVPTLQPPPPLSLACPITDTRWFVWRLATEADWQPFLYTVFGVPRFDPNGFLNGLKRLVERRLPVHIHPDHGMVQAIKRLCEAEKTSLIRHLGRLGEKRAPPRPSAAEEWLHTAVSCVRDGVVFLTLVSCGRPVYARPDVLSVIQSGFGDYTKAVRAVYRYKCSEEGRAEFDARFASIGQQALDEARALTRELVALWNRIMARADDAIVTGASPLTWSDEDWLPGNERLYGEFLSAYLDRVRDGAG
jgi:hypothetical protein